MTKEADIQKKQVFDHDFKVTLNAACTLGNGVLHLSQEEEEEAMLAFEKLKQVPGFFIPASGSGSRMFQLLFEWSAQNKDADNLESAFQTLSKLAIAGDFLREVNSAQDFTSAIIEDMACKPKGLIPFHNVDGKIYTAFQEHVLQAKKLFPEGVNLHFTIQRDFEEEIRNNISELGEQIHGLNISFSHQNPETDAYCFNTRGELVLDNGILLRRPAGHGALLENLNALSDDLVYIKNIDNIQHFNKADESMRTWKLATGLLKNFERDLIALSENFSKEALLALNTKYQFLSEDEVDNFTRDSLVRIISRPTRVCGMVKNEGEPGGGPFWVKNKDAVSKQIIEKVQISEDITQQEIVEGSSHFNPVFMVVSMTDVHGNRLDLKKFRDESTYFVVNKSHKGETIFYRELPGLWNGSMSNWNTIFLEIPSSVFSPVKTILDLAKPAHLA